MSALEGLCACGCGQPTPLAKQTRRDRGQVKGQPVKYIRGHSGPSADPVALFAKNVDRQPDDCWIWTGSTRGVPAYGCIHVGGSHYESAHRWSYKHHVGPIPDGLTIDHLCRTPLCVNPAHLEPVTVQENIARSDSPPARNGRKTHCQNGHEFTPENTYLNREGARSSVPHLRPRREGRGMTSLHEYLDEVLAPDDADSERFTVTDERSADWAARRVQQHRQAIAAKRAERDDIVAAADEWLERETKAHEDSAAYLEGLLADWLRREIDADPSKKPKVSRDLPCGATVKRTPARPSLVVEDEEALVTWLKEESPEHVEFVPKFSKADVKKLVSKDGLKVAGVRLEPGQHGWKVET